VSGECRPPPGTKARKTEAEAKAAWDADRAPGPGYAAGAEAMRQAAAQVAEAFPSRTHGALATAPYAAAEQAADEIAAAIRTLPIPDAPAPAWQPIETAPRDGTRVLCFAPAVKGEYPNPKWRVDVWRGVGWWEMRPDQPYTHWQPLPPPPVDDHG
jgi:hypothetical protein